MNLNENAEKRLVEILYYEVYQQIRRTVPNEKFYLYLESFCRAFDIDYTSISIVNNQFVQKLEPDKLEKTMVALITGVKLKDLGLDYRTIRAHKKKFDNREFQLYPRIINRYILNDLRLFVRRYLSLYLDEAQYLHQYFMEGGLDNDFSRSGRDSED
jgi:hypothetical protein